MGEFVVVPCPSSPEAFDPQDPSCAVRPPGEAVAVARCYRRSATQIIHLERFLIDDSEEVTGTFARPFDLLIEASEPETAGRRTAETLRGPGNGPRGLSYESLMEPAGLEPATFWLPARRSPS